jgi:hypothetical protein
MKRIIAFLLVLTAGTALSAQELQFSGYFNSGLGIVGTDSGAPLSVRAFGNDAQANGFRFLLNGAFTNAVATAGASFRFQSQATTYAQSGANPPTALGYFSLPYAYGWVTFFKGLVHIKAGIVDDATWSSAGYLLGRSGGDQGEGLGALLRISPVTGLDLGFGAYAISLRGGPDNSFLAKTTFGGTVELDDIKYTFNLGFTIPELLRFVASFRTKNASGVAVAETSRALAGISILAVKDLTAILEGEFNRLTDFSNTGAIGVYETLGYKLGGLGFGLRAAEYLSQAANTDLAVEIAPWVEYAFGNIAPRLDVTYYLGGTAPITTGGNYGRLFGYNAVTYNTGNRLINFRPSVKFNVGTAFVELGDIIYLSKTAAVAAAGAAPASAGTDTLWNVFYVDFKWSF